MSHVLLAGADPKVEALRFLLMKWGVTSGRLGSAGEIPTVHDGDAVIVAGGAAAERLVRAGTLPHGPGGAAGPAAPLICIADGEPTGPVPDSWLVLPQVDPDGTNLRLALQSSVRRARSLRGEPAPAETAPAEDSYLHFLGHELRSPLTAIKTSLEVLEGELGGLDREGAAPRGPLKMLAIALRNVRRLHKTVEWSQDLLAARAVRHVARPRPTAVAEMVARCRDLGEVRCADAIAAADLAVDPDLLEKLVTQAARALDLACPDRPLTVRLDAEAAAGGLRVTVLAADGELVTPGAALRARRDGAAPEADPASALARIVDFMVAADLVRALGARVETVTGEAGPAVVVDLPVVPALAPTA